MIPITINGKKYQVKSIDELTAKEFIEVSRIEQLDKMKYLEWATGLKFEIIYTTKISQQVLDLIGDIQDIETIPVPKYLMNKHVKSYEISTIGQRFQIETCKHKGFDLLVFIVAVAFVNNPDITKVTDYMKVLYKQNYKDVMAVGNFFFQNLQNGRNTGMNYLSKIMYRIKTRLRKNRPA